MVTDLLGFYAHRSKSHISVVIEASWVDWLGRQRLNGHGRVGCSAVVLQKRMLRGVHTGVFGINIIHFLGVHVIMYHCFLLDGKNQASDLDYLSPVIEMSVYIFIQIIPLKYQFRRRSDILANVTRSSGCRAEKSRRRKLNVEKPSKISQTINF